MNEWFQEFIAGFKLNFVDGDKWKWLVDGLKNTLIITFFAVLLGIAIGVVIAVVRSTYDKNGESMRKKGGAGYFLLSFFNFICQVYLTVIRGTPVVVQLLIMYFIVSGMSGSFNGKTFVA